MRRVIQTAAVILTFANTENAQGFNIIARVDPIARQIQDCLLGKSSVALHLSKGVPFWVLHLDDTASLIVDFKEADWTVVSVADILVADGRITAARFGSFQAGWSRIEIEMLVDRVTGQAVL